MSEFPVFVKPEPPPNDAQIIESTNPIIQHLTSTGPIVEWIVPNFIPRSTMITLGGLAGAGKSVFSYHVGMAIATGTEFLGFEPTRPHRVLYFDQENSQPDMIQYERYAWIGLGKPDLQLLAENFWGAHFVLGTKDWFNAAAAEVKYHKPEFIIFDTATPAFAIENENDNGEATKAISQLRVLQHLVDPPATLFVLKHGKVERDAAGGFQGLTLRGAKAWIGAMDAVMMLTRGEGRPRKDGLANTKLHPHKTRAFGLKEPVTIEPVWTVDKDGIVLKRYEKIIGG